MVGALDYFQCLNKVIHWFVEQENYNISKAFKLHLENDMFREELHKDHPQANEWQCDFCKKIFISENFFQQHFDNRHHNLLNIEIHQNRGYRSKNLSTVYIIFFQSPKEPFQVHFYKAFPVQGFWLGIYTKTTTKQSDLDIHYCKAHIHINLKP